MNTSKESPPDTRPRAVRRRIANAKPVPANIGMVQRDGIPIEVAESMLFSPGVKLSNTMRKNCMAAREAVFVSTRVPKEFTVTLARKAKNASAAQLLKWARRVVVERAKVSRDYAKLRAKRAQIDPMKLHDIANAERMLSIMDIEAQRCDATMASYRVEAERRLLTNDVFNPVRD